MTAPVQRPRGPLGHHPRYAQLPWPADVTQDQIIEWAGEYWRNEYSAAPVGRLPSPPASGLLAAQLDRIELSQARIQDQLDALLEALADEGEEVEQRELTLDGQAVGGERDDSQPL